MKISIQGSLLGFALSLASGCDNPLGGARCDLDTSITTPDINITLTGVVLGERPTPQPGLTLSATGTPGQVTYRAVLRFSENIQSLRAALFAEAGFTMVSQGCSDGSCTSAPMSMAGQRMDLAGCLPPAAQVGVEFRASGVLRVDLRVAERPLPSALRFSTFVAGQSLPQVENALTLPLAISPVTR